MVLGYLRRLVDQKALSVLLITHKFREVFAFCDSVTVLRRGRPGTGRTCFGLAVGLQPLTE